MRCLLTIFAFYFLVNVSAQHILKGTVRDEAGLALPGSTVLIEGTFMGRITNEKGEFVFPPLPTGSYFIKVIHLGYKDQMRETDLGENQVMDFVMQVQAVQAEVFTVIGFRADEAVPMAYQNLSAEDLLKRNLGTDVPTLLDVTPSLYFTSDAGTGIGYTYLRLRGSDQSNINVMINGIPLNDAESQGVFWVDLPDLASSSENIQIQRGVGTSVNGAGGFGGSINVQTKALATEPYANVSLSGGSFNTRRISVQAGTGLLDDHWSLDTRLSRISSDGYIDRSSAELDSYYLAGGYVNGKNSIRVLGFGGHEVTQQAWYGVPRALIENDMEGTLAFAADNGFSQENTNLLLNGSRTYNYYTYDNEVDDYQQVHYAREFSKYLRASAALHYTHGQGFFEQYQDVANSYDDTDYAYYGLMYPVIGNDTLSSSDFIRRRWLDNDFYGFTSNISWNRGKLNSVFGVAANRYEGQHYGEVIKASFLEQVKVNQRYYDNDAVKSEISGYIRSTYDISSSLTAYVDLQQRSIDYRFLGLLFDGSEADQNVSYAFFNPKAGLSYSSGDGHRAFLSYARAHKEPNRDDLVISTANSRPQAQRLDDVELGYSYRAKDFAIELVAYSMDYKDQLINTGRINDVGESIRTNVSSSYRRGLEFIGNLNVSDRVKWKANATWSKNIIKDHTERIVNYDEFYNVNEVIEDLGDSPISFSPEFMAYSEWNVGILKRKDQGISISLATKYVGEQHLDNSGNRNRMLDSFLVNDVILNWDFKSKRLKGLHLTFQVRNILDEKYESNGWTYRYQYEGEEQSFDALFPQAGRNFLAGINLDL